MAGGRGSGENKTRHWGRLVCIPVERLHSSVIRQVTPLCLRCLVYKMGMQNYLIRSIQKLNNDIHDRCLEQWLAHCRISVGINSFIIV